MEALSERESGLGAREGKSVNTRAPESSYRPFQSSLQQRLPLTDM